MPAFQTIDPVAEWKELQKYKEEDRLLAVDVLQDLCLRVGAFGVPLAAERISRVTGGLSAFSALTIKFAGLMLADYVADIKNTEPPIVLAEAWKGAVKGTRVNLRVGGSLAVFFCGCLSTNYYMKADDTKLPKKKRSELARREFEGKEPVYPKDGISFSVYGAVLSWSANEVSLFAGFTEGALCDQYHPAAAAAEIAEPEKPPDAMLT